MFNGVDAAPAAAIDGRGVPTVVWAAESTTGEPPLHVPMSSVVLLDALERNSLRGKYGAGSRIGAVFEAAPCA